MTVTDSESHNVPSALEQEVEQLLATGQTRKLRKLLTSRCERHHDSEACEILGQWRHSLGQFDLAIAAFEQALAAAPDSVSSRIALAMSELANNGFDAARATLEQGLSRTPGSLELRYNLAVLLHRHGLHQDAIGHYQQVVSQQRAPIDSWLGLAICQTRTGQRAAAIASYRAILKRDDSQILAHQGLSSLLESMGQLEAAAKIASVALARWPENIAIHIILARVLRREREYHKALELLKRLDRQALTDEQQQEVLFEQAKNLDKLEKYHEVIECLERKGQLALAQWQTQGRDADQYCKRLATLEQWCQKQPRPAVSRGTTTPAEQPVFLVGFPRSGTTLLDQILDANPAVQTLEEKPTVAFLEQQLMETSAGYPAILGELEPAHLTQLRQNYWQQLEHFMPNRNHAAQVIDKMPLNMARAALILSVFPQAKFILMLRHPLDVVLSCFMQNFVPNEAMINFHSLTRTAQLYRQVFDHWHTIEQHYQPDMMTIKYEDLLDDIDGQSERLCRFLNIDFSPNMLAFHQHARARENLRTPSYSQVSQPLYQHARYRWQNYQSHLEKVRPILDAVINRYGY